MRSEQGEAEAILAINSNIGQRKAREREIQRLALFDALTGLPNRAHFMQRMGQALAAAQRQRQGGALLLRLGLLYFAFGATFMVFGTFIVTTMVRDYGFSEAQAGGAWSWVGFCSLFSGVVFGAVSDRIGRKPVWRISLIGLIAVQFMEDTMGASLRGNEIPETGPQEIVRIRAGKA